MPITIVDVDDIVGADEFDEFLGGQVFTEPMKLAPDAWGMNAKPARQYALDRVLDSLRGRVPPIYYPDLSYPEELRPAILAGAAEHLYQLAMSTSALNDNYAKQRELWEAKFNSILNSLTLTLVDNRKMTGGFTVSRR